MRFIHRSALLPLLAAIVLATAAPLLAANPKPKPNNNSNNQLALAQQLVNHVTFLADDALAGRLTGSEGEAMAAEYLMAELQSLGVKPLPGRDGYLMPFEYTSGSRDTGSTVTVSTTGDEAGSSTWGDRDKVQALSFSENGTAEGDVVFVGYGIRVPDSQDFGYDSYVGLDVEDKIVVALRYFPEDSEGDARATLARYSGPRFKAMTAREQGAKALVLITGPRSPNAGEVMPMTFDTAISGSGIVAASASAAVIEALFANHDPIEEIQKGLDSANPHVTGFALEGVQMKLTVELERERGQGHNVVGVLPASNASDLPAVALGAHFDHLGKGNAGNSLARGDEANQIHNGADDNASGTAAVLEIVDALRGSDRARDLVVAFWSGEELGLLGAHAFVRSREDHGQDVAAYVNLDMVGRARDNKLSAQATGSSPIWPKLLEQSNVLVGWNLQLQEDPYLPTDSAAFNQVGIPTLNFFTGSHEDYHRPTDDTEGVDFAELERVVDLSRRVVGKLVNHEEAIEFTKVEPKNRGGGDRDTLRAFTGTIPDYATEIEGLLLGGVVGGGPAEEAGLRGGDVIVEFAGQTITNIYDYTYALDSVKVGVPIQVVFLRDGERMEVTLTPRARK